MEDLRVFCAQLHDDADEYTAGMADLLLRREMRMLQLRVERLLADGVFPLPGPGPESTLAGGVGIPRKYTSWIRSC